MDKTKRKFGFTLIELLVVISIIGLLSTVAMVSLQNARKKLRDARRLADIASIQKALDLYYDKYGEFPRVRSCGATVPSGSWANSVECLSNGHWIWDFSNGRSLDEFLSQDPVSPTDSGTVPSNYFYSTNCEAYYMYSNWYDGDGQWYMIVFRLEQANHSFQDEDGITAPDSTYFHYGNGSNGIITIGRNNVN